MLASKGKWCCSFLSLTNSYLQLPGAVEYLNIQWNVFDLNLFVRHGYLNFFEKDPVFISGKKTTFLIEKLSVAAPGHCVFFLLVLKKVGLCLKRKKMKVCKETLKKTVITLYRSTVSIAKPSTSSRSSGKSQKKKKKNSSNGSREKTHIERIEWIAKSESLKEIFYNVFSLFRSFKKT